MKKISRNEFIELSHKNYLKNEIKSDSIYFEIKDSSIIIPVDGLDALGMVTEFTNNFKTLTRETLGEPLGLEQLEAISFIKDNIRDDYKYEAVIDVPFNDVYDYLLEKKLIQSNKMQNIIRIEGEIDGETTGFYNYFTKINKSLSDYFDINSKETPSPIEDGVLKSLFGTSSYKKEKREDWFFGYASEKQMFNWLRSDEKMLNFIMDNSDLSLNIYSVNDTDMLSSEKQVAYKHKNATLKESKKLNEVLSILKEKFEYDDKIKNDKIKNNKTIKTYLKDDNGGTMVVEEKIKGRKKNQKNDNQLSLF